MDINARSGVPQALPPTPFPIAQSSGGAGDRRALDVAGLKEVWAKLGLSDRTIGQIESEVAERFRRPFKRDFVFASIDLSRTERDAVDRELRRRLAPELPKNAHNCTLYANVLLMESGHAPLGYPGGPGSPLRNYASVKAARQNLRERGAQVVPVSEVRPGDVVIFTEGSAVEHSYVAVNWRGRTLLSGLSDYQIQIRDPSSERLRQWEAAGELRAYRLP